MVPKVSTQADSSSASAQVPRRSTSTTEYQILRGLSGDVFKKKVINYFFSS